MLPTGFDGTWALFLTVGLTQKTKMKVKFSVTVVISLFLVP